MVAVPCNIGPLYLVNDWIGNGTSNCYHACGLKTGLCVDVCGENGHCCVKGIVNGTCEKNANAAATTGTFSCVTKGKDVSMVFNFIYKGQVTKPPWIHEGRKPTDIRRSR